MPKKFGAPAAAIVPALITQESLAEHLPVLGSNAVSKNAHATGPGTLASLKSIRVTSLLVWEQCPRQWKARYLDGKQKEQKPSSASSIGTLVHEVVETFMRKQWNLRTPIHTEITKRMAEAGVPNKELIAMDEYLHRLEGMRDKVVALEQEFSLPIPGWPIPLVGHIDLVLEGDPETLIIRDHKTNRTPQSLEYWQSNLQPRLYALAARLLWPQFKRVMFSIGYVNLKRNVTWETNPDDDAVLLRWLGEQWNDLTLFEGSGSWIAVPSDEHCRFCPVKMECEDYDGKDKALIDSLLMLR